MEQLHAWGSYQHGRFTPGKRMQPRPQQAGWGGDAAAQAAQRNGRMQKRVHAETDRLAAPRLHSQLEVDRVVGGKLVLEQRGIGVGRVRSVVGLSGAWFEGL